MASMRPSANLPQVYQATVEVTQSLTQVFQNILKKLSPPPKSNISEWADLERKLSPDASAEPGRWQTSRAPYRLAINDAMCDPAVETVVFMSGAQDRKTELLLNAIGFYICHDPSPILVLQPNLSLGQAFLKDRLAPMIHD